MTDRDGGVLGFAPTPVPLTAHVLTDPDGDGRPRRVRVPVVGVLTEYRCFGSGDGVPIPIAVPAVIDHDSEIHQVVALDSAYGTPYDAIAAVLPRGQRPNRRQWESAEANLRVTIAEAERAESGGDPEPG